MNTEIIENTIYNNGAYGLYGAGTGNGDVLVEGNVFGLSEDDTTPVHMRMESGIIDLTGDTNFFNFGGTAMEFSGIPASSEDAFDNFFNDFEVQSVVTRFAPTRVTELTLVNNTIGEQFFNGQSAFFVKLENGAFFAPGTPTILDATDSRYVTPAGIIRPSDTLDFVTADTFDFLEARFEHFTDNPTLGLFFFGVVPSLDIEDFLRQFGAFGPLPGNVQFTLNGLPFVDPAFALAALAPEAGASQDGLTTAEQLAGIEPAAGGNAQSGEQDVSCWGDAVNAAGTGSSVNFSFGTGLDDTLSAQASCSETF